MSVSTVLYAHGFEGRPDGPKAEYLEAHLNAQVIAPCMWSEGWTLNEHVKVLDACLDAHPEIGLVVGSSMGGFAAAIALQRRQNTTCPALLMAPAIGIHSSWQKRLGPQIFEAWQQSGTLTHFHGGAQKHVELPFELWTQCRDEAEVCMLCPTVIIHGIDDEVVPIANSRRLAARSPSVLTILEANAGHQLNEDLSLVLEAVTLLGLR